jgi:hypothetical protein
MILRIIHLYDNFYILLIKIFSYNNIIPRLRHLSIVISRLELIDIFRIFIFSGQKRAAILETGFRFAASFATGLGAPMNPATPSKVQKSLEIIAQLVTTSPTDAPAQFVRDLAHYWKERGGRVAGKPRHSDRYLDDLLRARGTPIKSLIPKLARKTKTTNLKPGDADVLVRVFLSHWHYVGDPDSGASAGTSAGLYEPLLSDADIEDVCKYVAERISDLGVEARSGVESKAQSTSQSVPGQDTDDLIANEFQDAAVLFFIGAGQMMLVPRPEGALLGFRDLITRLWAIEQRDDKRRILIWALDLGRQDIDDLESRVRFLNVQALVTRFKALKRFRENVSEARWNWLQSRTVIVLHDTRSVQPLVPRLPTFDPNHVLFSAIPPRWAGSPEFRELYGDERLQETNYTISLRRSSEPARQSAGVPSHALESFTLRYFGHAVLKSEEKDKREARGLGLKAPGLSYADALGTVFVAAAQMLSLQSVPEELLIDGMRIESAHAIEKLRHHGFLLLRLDEFVNF